MASLISVLAAGIPAAASGTAELYSQGTSTLSSLVFSDANGINRATTHALDAYGSVIRYVEEPVDVIVKDSTGAIIRQFTHMEDSRCSRVETSPFSGPSTSGNGQNVVGGRTTVSSALSQVALSGTTVASGSYAVFNVLSYGANKTGSSSSNTAIASAIAAAAAAGGGVIYLPAGTYKTTTQINVTAPNISFAGDGIGLSTIKNYGTASRAIYLNPGSLTVMNMTIEGLSITANTTSTQFAIEGLDCQYVNIRDVSIASHGGGIYANFTSNSSYGHWWVERNRVSLSGVACDDSAFYAYGRGVRFRQCYATGGSASGTEIGFHVSAENVTVYDCHAENMTTGANACGFKITSSSGSNASLVLCTGAGNTLDLFVDTPNSNVMHVANQFATVKDGSQASAEAPRVNTQSVSSALSAFTVTADFTTTSSYPQTTVLIVASYSAGAPTATIANPTNLTYLGVGTILEFSILKTGANQLNLSWGAKFLDADGSTAFGGLASIAANSAASVRFALNTSGNLVCLGVGATVAK